MAKLGLVIRISTFVLYIKFYQLDFGIYRISYYSSLLLRNPMLCGYSASGLYVSVLGTMIEHKQSRKLEYNYFPRSHPLNTILGALHF